MAPRPTAAILRWFHHRSSADYRELQESFIGCGIGFLGKSPKSWRTVPGLILEDDSSIIFDDFSAREVMRLKQGRSEGRSSFRRSNRRRVSAGNLKVAGHNESKNCDSQSIETTYTEDESEPEEQQSKMLERSVRWADAAGRELAVTKTMDMLPYVSTRVVILLLDLNERLFEFVQCEFDTDNRLTVSDVLKQLPCFASIDYLARQRFRTLCRPHEEFLNMLPLQNYEIREGEILVAAGGSARPKEVMAAANALLEQKKLVRAVHKAKLSGRALQRLLSSAQLADLLERGRQVVNVEKAVLDDSTDTAEEQDMGDSALIVKVLSKELGENLINSDFAGSSFPAFDAEDAFTDKACLFGLGDSTDKAKPGWFDELLAASYDDEETFDFFVESLPDLQGSTHGDASSELMTSEQSCEDQLLDAFGTSSDSWNLQDAVVPEFPFPEH